MNNNKLKVLVIGCGNMGSSHARAYKKHTGFELAGLVDSNFGASDRLSRELGGIPTFKDLNDAIRALDPDCAAVCTYPDSHAAMAKNCLERRVHLFVEKPLATTVKEAQDIVSLAREKKRKVVVGYILRQNPAWIKFIEVARRLGKPLVMRMNLNQQSVGNNWTTHKNLMKSMSPIVDCGVHYVDVMCQMTRSKPVSVHAIGARLSNEIAPEMYNYGQLQVRFEDGSVGWYEAGWGPMMSETAFFVKDVVGPKGSVSIVGSEAGASANIDSHTKINQLRLHYSDLNSDGTFAKKDEMIAAEDDPGHQGLCDREQDFFNRAIREDLDLTDHLEDAVNSLQIVMAADKSFRTNQVVRFDGVNK